MLLLLLRVQSVIRNRIEILLRPPTNQRCTLQFEVNQCSPPILECIGVCLKSKVILQKCDDATTTSRTHSFGDPAGYDDLGADSSLMAAVGARHQQSSSGNNNRVSMSVSMSLVQGGAAQAKPPILVAAAPYYQPSAVPLNVQPDRTIGYGAFGVVW